MTASQSQSDQEQIAKDDAHLRALGIKPELKRSLGFISVFAVAFSYISVSTGTFTNQSVGYGVGGPATVIWAWVMVIIGQSFVALNFAELSSHFPIAGSIYQWSKRLSHRTLGWFTGWIYFWAGVVTVTAVAATVPLVLSTIFPDSIVLADPSPIPTMDMQSFLAIVTLIISTVINIAGTRILAIVNNIGVVAEILGMLVFAIILLVFFNHQPLSVITDTSLTTNLADGNFSAVFLVGALMALFVVYGFDTAGTFGEETVDAARRAPRGVLSAIWISGIIGLVFLLAVTLSFQDMNAAITEAQGFGFPIATTLKQNMSGTLIGNWTFGDIYLFVILIAVFVCTLAIQGATTRLMFSMGRDGRMPLGKTWGHVNGSLGTPANAALAVAVLAAIPLVLTGAGSAAVLAIAATGLIYLSYFLCNLGVLFARFRGFPHQPAPFSLGRWGKVINIIALVWGGLMIINIALWTDPIFGIYGNDLRATWTNPFINTFLKFQGQVLEGLPAWPVFETVLGVILLVGLLYYVFAERGKIDQEVVGADVATGESVIG